MYSSKSWARQSDKNLMASTKLKSTVSLRYSLNILKGGRMEFLPKKRGIHPGNRPTSRGVHSPGNRARKRHKVNDPGRRLEEHTYPG
jgi:hypothetical protein